MRMVNSTVYRAKGKQFNSQELELRLKSQLRKILRKEARACKEAAQKNK